MNLRMRASRSALTVGGVTLAGLVLLAGAVVATTSPSHDPVADTIRMRVVSPRTLMSIEAARGTSTDDGPVDGQSARRRVGGVHPGAVAHGPLRVRLICAWDR